MQFAKNNYSPPLFSLTRITIAILSLSTMPHIAMAAQAHLGDETILQTIVITAAPQTSPLTIVVDPKAPRQPIPASDGADFLKTIPGFSAIRNGGTNGDPVLRGMFGSRLNILANGSAMLGACPGRMDAPTSYISPESYDKLTVIKGPQSVIWGPGASAGTVLFERKTERFDENGLRFDGGLTAGSFGRNEQSADLTVGTPDVYTRVIANHAKANDYKDGNNQTVASRWNKWNVDAAVGFTPDANTLLELNAGVGDGSSAYAGRGMDGVSFKRHNFNAKFEKRNISERIAKIEAMVYYNYADHLMDNYTLRQPDPHSMMKMPMASEVDRRTVGARVAATLQWDDTVQLITGFDAQQNVHRARAGMGRDTYASMPWNKDATFSNAGLFGELTWHVDKQGRVIGGARIDRATAKDARATLGSGMMAATNPTANVERHSTLPSGFVRYEYDLPSTATTVYAGLGHAERFPDYWELFSPKAAPSGSPNAFAGIRPEKTTQLDIGAQYKAGPWQAWTSAYVGVVNDFILFSYMPGHMGMMTSQANNIDAQIMGGEVGASYSFAKHWKMDSSLAYAWGRNRSDGKALPQMPPLDTKLSLSYNDQRWSFGALWRIVSAQNRIAINQGNVVGKDFGPTAGFGVLSLNGGYAFSKNVQLIAGIDNVFNKAYAEHLNLAGNAGFGYGANTPMNDQGRTGWLKLGVKY